MTTSKIVLFAVLLALSVGSVVAAPRNVGVLVFNDVFITEFVAPFDVFKHAGAEHANVFLVGPSHDAIKTYEGVTITPQYGFADAPKLDVIVVPSGNRSLTGGADHTAMAEFVKRRAGEAELVTSHCWGAFTLAQAGLLDGKRATTFPTSIDELSKRFPRIHAVKGERFVQDGKVVTSNGGVAAFEAALFVVDKLFGKQVADTVASGMVFAPQNIRLARYPVLVGVDR